MSPAAPRTWFITGANRGFGRSLSLAALEHGDRVVATARRAESLAPIAERSDDRVRCHALDVDDAGACRIAVAYALAEFGAIDVLVNNAGYGLSGAIEELGEDEARAQMETNFFGAMRLTQRVLPGMRERRRGHILQISSIAGFVGTPGLGLYNASKFALEGLSEALAAEVAPFGIRVTIIEPGPFRTDWAGPSLATPRHLIDAYKDSAHPTITRLHDVSGRQPGDPDKAAQVMIQVVEAADPPLRLPLGDFAIDRTRQKIAAMAAETDRWESASRATAFTPT